MNQGRLPAHGVGRQAMRRRLAPLWFVVVLVLAVGGVVWAYGRMVKEVVILVDDQAPVEMRTRVTTVAEALREAGIAVSPYDAVSPTLETQLDAITEIVIQRAVAVHITADGQTQTLHTTAKTVAEALAAAGVEIGEKDRVTPALHAHLGPDLEIKVVRVVEEWVIEKETLPYATIHWAAPHLPQGETNVVREGRTGELERRIRIIYEDGVLVSREIVSEEVTVEPINRIIEGGTRQERKIVQTPEGPMEYIEVRQMVATGYEASPISTGEWSDGYTFVGLRARRGVIAVDPTVIPLGTRLYVPGYGVGIAADIGGAIKGNIIDLFFETYEEAIQWGRQTVDVYILAP